MVYHGVGYPVSGGAHIRAFASFTLSRSTGVLQIPESGKVTGSHYTSFHILGNSRTIAATEYYWPPNQQFLINQWLYLS